MFWSQVATTRKIFQVRRQRPLRVQSKTVILCSASFPRQDLSCARNGALMCENAAKLAMTSSEQDLRFWCDHAFCYDCYSDCQRKMEKIWGHSGKGGPQIDMMIDDERRMDERCYPVRVIALN